MSRRANDVHRRLDALRAAVELLMNEGYEPAYVGVAGASGPFAEPERRGSGGTHETKPRSDNEPDDDTDLAASSEESHGHISGPVRPVPRGSKRITSRSSASPGPSSANEYASIPGSPGPPWR